VKAAGRGNPLTATARLHDGSVGVARLHDSSEGVARLHDGLFLQQLQSDAAEECRNAVSAMQVGGNLVSKRLRVPVCQHLQLTTG